MAKKYKNYRTKEEFDEIPLGFVSVGEQPDGTYIIQNSDKSYSRVSANDPRVPKMASETIEPVSINTKSGIDMYEGANENPEVDKALNEMGNTWMFHPQRYIYNGYFNSDTHNNVREGGNMAARYITDIATFPFIGRGVWDAGKSLFQGGKALYKMWGLNPVHGAYETTKTAIPFITSLFAGAKGAQLVDQGMVKFNGKTWGENIQELTGYPRIVAESTNPGAALSGYIGYKFPNSYLNGVEKRAIEMSMRSTDAANPIHTISEGLKWTREHPFSKLTRDRLKYLFTGLKGRGKYNNLQPELWYESPYNGEQKLGLSEGAPVDLAVGTSTVPHPSIGKLANDGDLGPLTDYVETSPTYSGRTKIIDVEQPKLSGDDIDYASQGDLPYITEEILTRQSIDGNNSFFTQDGAQINTAGHRIQLRLNPTTGQPEYRRFDIWKFNPEDYWFKWLDYSIPSHTWQSATLAEKRALLKPIINQSWKNRITDAGLRIVDSRINPYVYRTNWAPYPILLKKYFPQPSSDIITKSPPPSAVP